MSLHDFSFHRPNVGLSTLNKSSNTFLNIIYIGRELLKFVFRFEEVIKWTTFTTSMTYRTIECVSILDTGFFHELFPLSIGSSSSIGTNDDRGLTSGKGIHIK